MQHDIAGDPISGVKWTRRTTQKIADELHKLDAEVCANTVAKLLKQLNFKLRVNHKRSPAPKTPIVTLSSPTSPSSGLPSSPRVCPSSASTPRRRSWSATSATPAGPGTSGPVPVNAHDFRFDAIGIANPYGVYDLQANLDSLFVGTQPRHPRLRR